MMGILSDIRVRQPAKDDLVGRQFTVAGIGTGFEGTIGMRLLNRAGKVIATGFATSTGGMALIGEFSAVLKVKNPPRAGTPVKLQVFGDNPGPGSAPGSVVREARDFGKTTVAQIVAANSQIKDPDVIQTGWKLRIPISN